MVSTRLFTLQYSKSFKTTQKHKEGLPPCLLSNVIRFLIIGFNALIAALFSKKRYIFSCDSERGHDFFDHFSKKKQPKIKLPETRKSMSQNPQPL